MTVSGDEAGTSQRATPDRASRGQRARTASQAAIELTRVEAPSSSGGPLSSAPDDLPAAPRKALLGRYSLLRKLGEGGMGVVYSAFDEELDRRVAIKLLRVKSGDAASAGDRMLREAQLMAKLSHPHVVQVYDVGVLSGQVFLAMEFVQGPTLREWLHGTPEEPRPPRPWPEVLAMYLQAGQGLAAAHAAGLVHRDFKPDNVLVGADGRARVLDFGLARSDGHSDEVSVASERSERSEGDSSRSRRTRSADRPLTLEGALVGTPAYMSPEQHLRIATDPRSDQFSFCVSLYEGIYGERPFAGHSTAELRSNTLTGRVRDPPPGRKIPAWLRKVLLRGLRVVPEQRFASMAALLSALSADPGRVRRRWLSGLALVALAGTVGLALAQRRSVEAEVCRNAETLLAGAWDPTRAAAVEAALTATGLAYARDTWPRVQEQLDMFASAWKGMHVEVCEATNVHRSQSSALMDLRMACLADSRDELRAAVDVLADADAQVAERAVQVATGLRPLVRCADTAALTAGHAAIDPRDPGTAAAVRDLHALLAQVRAEDIAGRYVRGLQLAREAVVVAERTAHGPARAEALLHRGRLEASTADYIASESSYETAYWLAEAVGEDRVRAEAAVDLVEVVGERRGRDHDSMQWARQAEALLHRLGDPPELEAPLRAKLGVVHTRFGRYDEALPQIDRAIALGDRPGDPRLSMYHRHLGNVHYRRGRHAEAAAAYARAVELGEAALGADHPDVARSINNLGETHRVQGHFAEAERYFLRSISVWEQAFGRQHSLLAAPYNGLGTLALARGDTVGAASHFERVRLLLEHSLGPDHPDVGAVTSNLGEVLLLQGMLAESRRHSERALQILEKALGPDHDGLSDTLSNLARVLVLEGRFPEAAHHYERAISILERAHGPNFADLTKPLMGLGLLALARDRPAEASGPLERALGLGGTRDPAELAELRLALARALWDTRDDRPRARALAELARTELQTVESSPSRLRLLGELAAWLAAHPT